MKVSVSLASEDLEFLDEYARAHAISSRSATVHEAIRALRLRDLDVAYDAAWREWAESGEGAAWDATVGDGL